MARKLWPEAFLPLKTSFEWCCPPVIIVKREIAKLATMRFPYAPLEGIIKRGTREIQSEPLRFLMMLS